MTRLIPAQPRPSPADPPPGVMPRSRALSAVAVRSLT